MRTSVQRVRLLAAAALVITNFPSIVAAGDNDPRRVISSTIPKNGDLNPYGIVFVPDGFGDRESREQRGEGEQGSLKPGDVLVTNFNNKANLQGLGTTIIKLNPDGPVAQPVPVGQPGHAVTFFESPLRGLTTAFGVLQAGLFVVGNMPTTDGTSGTVQQGALQIVDASGNVVTTLTHPKFLDGPWDLTINDRGRSAQIFVSNVLNGTVSRLDVMIDASSIAIANMVTVAEGYTFRPDPSALELGPTGLAYDPETDILYVASTADNKIFAVADAGDALTPGNKGTVVFADQRHLHGPLGLVFAPNGHLITANGDAVNPDPAHPSEIVEFTKRGEFVREFSLDPALAAPFGLATVLKDRSDSDNPPTFEDSSDFDFAAVNDNRNTVTVYHRISDAFTKAATKTATAP
ncbi:MAG TPA: hypothetical protein VKW08_13570 [Xanthobacteraceae bacterium]|nr:hypothetical protein [Xanthobacteraceae bacterium]